MILISDHVRFVRRIHRSGAGMRWGNKNPKHRKKVMAGANSSEELVTFFFVVF